VNELHFGPLSADANEDPFEELMDYTLLAAWPAYAPDDERFSMLNQSHAGTHMPFRSRACEFHLGFGLDAEGRLPRQRIERHSFPTQCGRI